MGSSIPGITLDVDIAAGNRSVGTGEGSGDVGGDDGGSEDDVVKPSMSLHPININASRIMRINICGNLQAFISLSSLCNQLCPPRF